MRMHFRAQSFFYLEVSKHETAESPIPYFRPLHDYLEEKKEF